MSRATSGVLYTLVMIAVIVAMDLLLFQDHPWERLAANAGVVLLAGALYFRFFVSS